MAARRLRHRHHRAIVCWSIAAAAIMQIGFGSAIELALPAVRDPEYAHREGLLRDRLAENDGRPVVVFEGSSHIHNGVDAASAMAAINGRALLFNFGIPSSGPFLERICTDRLRASGVKPDLVVIEVTPAHFNANRSLFDLQNLNGARLDARELSQIPTTWDTFTGPVQRWLVGRAVPCYRHQSELRAELGLDDSGQGVFGHPDLQMVDRFGWQARAFPDEQLGRLRELAHRQYDPSYRDFVLCPLQVRQLERNLHRCQKAGIQTALLLMPEGSEFRALYSPAMTAAIDRMTAEFRNRFGTTVIDARAWLPDVYFLDMHHLRWDGAGVFSKRLAQEYLGPLVRERTIAQAK